MFENVRVCAFVGPSGTGKSYRAQLVASENNIKYIIDDGLLIDDNEVVAGTSAKKAPTKIETIKHALFNNEEEKKTIIDAFMRLNIDSILILGTSDGMVEKIAENLGLPKISKTIYIQDVATEEEMQKARRMRVTEGKHVIPVPTFEIKKDFSGFLLDPLQIFKSKGSGNEPYIAEKSIVRPTFSYMGNFTISDTVFRQIINLLYKKENDDSIRKVSRIRINKYGEGMSIYMEAAVKYGCCIPEVIEKFQGKVKKEIERLTTMNVQKIEVLVRSIKFDDEYEIID
jgi:uncharacterized alkaline shock family protein YloU